MKFSIVTPVYNGIMHVEGFVLSLQAQVFTDWEAVVVDDGSTDGTYELLLELTSSDPRFRIAQRTSPKVVRGPYMARNMGLDLATGDYICFLDIDDRWFSFKLSRQASIIQQDPTLCLLISGYVRSQSFGVGKTSIRRPPPSAFVKPYLFFSNPVPMLTSCVKKSLLEGIRFKPLYHEDYVFWWDALSGLSSARIFSDSFVLGVYAVASSSLSGNKVKAIVWIWRCYREFGYSIPVALVALVLRAVYQLLLLLPNFFAICKPRNQICLD